MAGDRIVWDERDGGEVVSGPIRVSLPAVPPPDIPVGGWRGLVLEAIDYRPGDAYRVKHRGCTERDMHPAEMQACADWLARIDRRFMHAGQGV